MGKAFGNFVAKWMTDSGKYVPVGGKCCVCGKRLGFFATGLWSTNSRFLSDGAVCAQCHEKVKTLILRKQEWMSKSMKKEERWKKYTKSTWKQISSSEARELLALKEQADRGVLSEYGEEAQAFFRVREAFSIAPTNLEVGIARAQKMKDRVVVYGSVEEGALHKGDAVRIDGESGIVHTEILEAYIDDRCNSFELLLRASGGKQKIAEGQEGWLILDLQEMLSGGEKIIK